MPSFGGLLVVVAVAFLRVISVLGLAFLLFLAGLEIDLRRLRGPVLRLSLVGFAVSFALSLGSAAALVGAGLLSVLLLPITGLAVLRGGPDQRAVAAT
jgi:Kef-type K+ transport system membrane component KefB